MTWDQDQVDSFIKIFNWTNFEKKNYCLNTSYIIPPCNVKYVDYKAH